VHHIRNELTTPQLERIIYVYSRLIHNPALGHNLHTLSAKMMFGLLEPITTKETSSGIERLLGIMVESCLERLEALALMYEGVSANIALLKDNNGLTSVGPALIEKARPVGGAFYAIEKPEEVIHGQSRYFSSSIVSSCSLLFRIA